MVSQGPPTDLENHPQLAMAADALSQGFPGGKSNLCRTPFLWGPEFQQQPVTGAHHLIPVEERFSLEEPLFVPGQLVWKRLPCHVGPNLAFSHLRQLVSGGTSRVFDSVGLRVSAGLPHTTHVHKMCSSAQGGQTCRHKDTTS
jgi:hypothetical protein